MYAPLIAKQGDTFRKPLIVTINGQPYDTTGSTVVFHLRNGGDADVLTIGLTGINPVIGEMQLSITATQTAALDAAAAYYYEVEMTKGGDVLTVIEGTFAVLVDRG